jgi:spore coat protein U-like protein
MTLRIRDRGRILLGRETAEAPRMPCKTRVLAGFGLLGTLATLSPISTLAATTTTTMAISATVQATCLITAAPLGFGTYTGVALAGASTLSVTCTNTTPYNIGLSAGLATGATVTTRKMTLAAGALAYSLFSDAARNVNWGNTVGTDTPAVGPGNGGAQVINIYGSIAAAQFVAPGLYTDTITATITY